MAIGYDEFLKQYLEDNQLPNTRENRIAAKEQWEKQRPVEDVGATTEQEIADIAKDTASVSPYSTAMVFPTRFVEDTEDNRQQALPSGGLKYIDMPGGKRAVYSGDYLVNQNGILERPQYDQGGADLLTEYATITNPVELQTLFTSLREYGFYGEEGKPSALALSGRGLENKDETALQRFFNYSSGLGRTWRATLPILQGQAKLVTGGSGRTVSVVSSEDATRALKEESLRLLGRMPTRQELRAAISSIQATERSRGAGGSMDAPTLTTAAQEQVVKAAPGEAAAQAAGTAINQIFALLGGR